MVPRVGLAFLMSSIKSRKLIGTYLTSLCMLYIISSLLMSFLDAKKALAISYFTGQVILDVLISICALYFCLKEDGINKLSSFFLSIAYICAAISDGIYNAQINLLNISYTHVNDGLFDMPFIFFLFFSFAGLLMPVIYDFSQDRKHKIHISGIVNFLIILAIFSSILVCFFLLPWKIDYTSLIGVYQILDTIFEALIFCLALNMIIRARSLYLYYISIGYCLIVLSDIVIRSNVIQGVFIRNSFFECVWVVGLFFILIAMSKKKV